MFTQSNQQERSASHSGAHPAMLQDHCNGTPSKRPNSARKEAFHFRKATLMHKSTCTAEGNLSSITYEYIMCTRKNNES